MGIGGISIWQLAIVALIIVLLFGTKKLRGLGGDLGSAFKGFKKAVSDDESRDNEPHRLNQNDVQFADVKAASTPADQPSTSK